MRPYGLAKDVKLGAFCHLSPGCKVGRGVSMGNYVMCGPEVIIAPGEHNIDVPGVPVIFSGSPSGLLTIIEDDVWIGARVIVKAGVKIGRGSIIAMGAIVTRDVESYSVVGGITARKIKDRFDDASVNELHDGMLSGPAKAGSYCEF